MTSLKHFDLVAGQRLRASLLLGLGLGIRPLEMINFYKKEGPKIFPKDENFVIGWKSKHEAQTLRLTLKSILGDRNYLRTHAAD